MIAKIVTLLTILSVTMLIGNAYAESGASFINGKIVGNIGSLTGSGNVKIAISDPNGSITNLSIVPTSSGYFETPVSFTKVGNYITTVSYGNIIINTIPYSNVSVNTTPVYEVTTDGVINVEVFTIPFDVKITENGKVTIHNNDTVDHIVSHTGTTGTEKGGTFYKVIPNGSTVTIGFPITGNTVYPIGVYYFEDPVTGKTGKIAIEKWDGSAKVINDTTITGVTQGIVEPVGIQETIVAVITNPEGVKTVVTSETPVVENQVVKSTTIQLNNELIYTNKELTKALESIGLLKNELKNSLGVITTQQQEIVALKVTIDSASTLTNTEVLNLETTISKLETTVSESQIRISTLEVENIKITQERDEWKKLSDSWYAVAKEQLRVMVEVLGL